MVDKVEVEFGARTDELDEGIDHAKDKFREVAAPITELREALQGLIDPIRGIRNNLGEVAEGFAAAFAIDKVKDFAEAEAELGEHARNTAATLGMSVEAVSRFANLVTAMGGNAEEATRPLERLSRAIGEAATNAKSEQAQAFQSLGISLEEVKEHGNDTAWMLERLRQAWQQFGDGASKTNDFMILLGRGFDSLIPYLRGTDDAVAALNSRIQATGANLSGDLAEKMEETATSLHVGGLATEGLGHALFGVLKPAIDESTASFSGLVEGLKDAVREGGALRPTLIGLRDAFLVLAYVVGAGGAAIDAALHVVEAALEVAEEYLLNYAKLAYDAMTLNWSALKEQWAHGLDGLNGTVSGHAKAISDEFDGIVARARRLMQQLKSDLGVTPGTGQSGTIFSGMSEPPKPTPPSVGSTQGAQGATELEQFRQRLADMEASWSGTHRAMLAEAVRMWQQELASARLSAKERIAAETEYARAVKALRDADKREQAQIQKEDADTALEVSKIKLQSQRDELEAEVQAGKISEGQKVAQLKELAAQEHQLDEQRLRDELATLDSGTAAWERVFDQILVLQARFQAEMAQLERQGAEARRKEIEQEATAWRGVVREIDSAEQGMIRDLLSRRESFGQAAEQLAGRLVENEIAADLKWLTNKILLNALGLASDRTVGQEGLLEHLLTESAKTTATETGVAARTSAETAGSATSILSMLGSALKAIGIDAATTFGGIFAFLSPLMGPAAAGPAAAGEAAVYSAAGSIAAFDEGAWNIPRDMMGVLHAGETVVPTTFASEFRGNNFGAGAAAGAGAAPNITFAPQISSLNAKDTLAHLSNPTILRGLAARLSSYLTLNPSVRGAW